MAVRNVPKHRTRKILSPRMLAPRRFSSFTDPDLSDQYDKGDKTKVESVCENLDAMQRNIKDNEVSAKDSMTKQEVKQDENGSEAASIASSNAILEADLNFKRFITKLSKQLASTFSQVTTLAAYCVKGSGKPMNVSKTNKLYAKMEVACEFLNIVRLELDRILKREQEQDNIQTLLKITNSIEFSPCKEACLKYMPMVQSCKNTAKSIQHSVQVMMFHMRQVVCKAIELRK